MQSMDTKARESWGSPLGLSAPVPTNTCWVSNWMSEWVKEWINNYINEWIYECKTQKYEPDHPPDLRTVFFLYLTPSPHAWGQLPALKFPISSLSHQYLHQGKKNPKQSSCKEAGSPNITQQPWCWKPSRKAFFVFKIVVMGNTFLHMQHWGIW
jgi:hypothetical protein